MIFFIGRALAERLAAVAWETFRPAPAFLLAAAGSAVVRMCLGAGVYRLLLGPLCKPPPLVVIFAISWIARVGKYLPGKFASVLGTLWLFRRRGVPASVGASVIFLRQGLSLAVGLIAAVPLTLWQPVRHRLPLAWVWCVVLLAAGGVMLHPRVFFALGNFLLARLRLSPLRGRPGFGSYASSLAAIMGNAVMGGVGLWLLTRSVTAVPPAWVPAFVSCAALANVAGFLAVFAPGGLGVREGVLLIVLGGIIAPGDAAVVVVGSRLMLVTMEAVMAGAGLAILRLLPERGTEVG